MTGTRLCMTIAWDRETVAGRSGRSRDRNSGQVEARDDCVGVSDGRVAVNSIRAAIHDGCVRVLTDAFPSITVALPPRTFAGRSLRSRPDLWTFRVPEGCSHRGQYGRVAANYGRVPADCGRVPPNYGRVPTNYGRVAANYVPGPPQCRRVATHSSRVPIHCGRGENCYGRVPVDCRAVCPMRELKPAYDPSRSPPPPPSHLPPPPPPSASPRSCAAASPYWATIGASCRKTAPKCRVWGLASLRRRMKVGPS